MSHTTQHYIYHMLYKRTMYGPHHFRDIPLLGSKHHPKNRENILRVCE